MKVQKQVVTRTREVTTDTITSDTSKSSKVIEDANECLDSIDTTLKEEA